LNLELAPCGRIWLEAGVNPNVAQTTLQIMSNRPL
jgi:hypothetical protein